MNIHMVKWVIKELQKIATMQQVFLGNHVGAQFDGNVAIMALLFADLSTIEICR